MFKYKIKAPERVLIGGDEGDRTPDLRNAIAALSQLSYIPEGHIWHYTHFITKIK